MPSHLPYRLERRKSSLDKIDEKDGEGYTPLMIEVGGGIHPISRPDSPDSAGSSSPLLSHPTTPFSFGGASPFFPSPHLPRHVRRTVLGRARSNRVLYLAILVLGGFALGWREQDRPVVRNVRQGVHVVATRAREQRCRYAPWLAACPDPFAGLTFPEDHGEVIYPAVPSSNDSLSSSSAPVDPSRQPHPIHRLIRDAESAWHEKVSRQSRTLEEAVAEYRRRYNQPPPKGFDKWYAFAVKHNVQLVDEYDSIMERIQPFAALSPELLQKRSAMLQGIKSEQGEEEFWLHQHSVTIKVREKGTQVTADGPMRTTNNRADQILALMNGISEFLPDLNITITGHDVPWIVLDGEHKKKHIEAAERGEYLDDYATYQEDWSRDGWSLMCPPGSPLREASRFENRTEWTAPETTSFIGVDHVKAMDVCYHPENQAIHGYTSWAGPRPGLLLPMFAFSTTSLNTDLLLPPLEQYERPVGNDPLWADKKHDKAVWRGSTTGSDLTSEHARKYSQRVRLARLPHSTGEVTVPLATHDRPGTPGRVSSVTGSAQDFIDEYLDVKFMGWPKQCGDKAACAAFEKEFEWDQFMEEQEQNEYKYVLDVDGNGWSGRFHRLMASNTLVLKSTIFPEWYSERVQPWVHYVPIKTDYTDLLPVMAFFKGSPYDGSGGHDDIAEKIATAGKEWTGDFWRWEDMQAYFFRLLLEYGRIMHKDWSRSNMDYVPPAVPDLQVQ
ncbi:hypothetical protein JCM6882_002666 [Rhodosporidiobolus microsporus]